MPLIIDNSYKPSFPFRNTHVNTIYTGLWRKNNKPDFERERINTPDDDFYVVDWIKNKSKNLVVLSHGLEGSVNSQYMKNISSIFSNDGFDVAAYNFRSCGGVMNNTHKMYHSGFTQDLHQFIELKKADYRSISLIGISLGGNMMLKYLSDEIYPVDEKIKNAIILSAPIDLSGSAQQLKKRTNILYDLNFCILLIQKLFKKQKLFPDLIKLKHLRKVRKLIDIDEYYTGPLHGFDGAEDYYSKANALQFIEHIKVPTLMIAAKDDTFLSPKCYPIKFAKSNPYLHLVMPDYGGHVGFYTKGSNYFWHEKTMLSFVKENEYLRPS